MSGVESTDGLRIVTNNVPRDILDASELTLAERGEFDYLDWGKLEAGEDSASFFRYKGEAYDLGEFMANSGLPRFSPLAAWDGHMSDSYFSGIVVRYVNEGEQVVVGRFSC